jgi:signal transduction histidine kinase
LIIDANNRFVIWLLEKRWRIVAAGIFAVVAPLIGLSLYIYSHVTSELEGIVIAENQTLLNLTAYHLKEKIITEMADAKIFADRPLLVTALRNNDAKAVFGHLKNFIDNSLSIERVIVTTSRGIEVATYPDDPELAGMDLTDKDWYRGVSARWEPYVSDFFLRVAKPPRYLFSMAIPIREGSGNVLGILVLHPKEDYIKNVLSGMRSGGGFVYVVDKNGHLVYHPDYNMDRIYDFSGVSTVARVMKGLNGVEKGNDLSGRQVVISAFQPMEWGWGIIMQRPEKEVLLPVQNILIGLFIFTGISILIGIIVAYDGMEMLYSVRSLSVKLQERERIEREINAQLQHELAERRQAEQKLERTLEDLGRSNKELEQFAYVASHDLREPLRKVASFTELLARRYGEQMGPDADRYIGFIVDGAKRMSLLINDLLSFSRVGTATREFALTDCNEVLKHTIDDLQQMLLENMASVTYDDMPVIMADELQIGMIFQNLISNAVKFHGDQPPQVHVSAKKEGENWIMSVSDNGIGIEADYFNRIFTMFQRLHSKAAYPGTGIGLAICKKVVERHGGEIWVESEFGKGSTFCFKIPQMNKEVNESWPQ